MRTYHEHLGDDDAARRTLRALEERLQDPAAHGWLDLAIAYARTLRDPAAARRCLDVLRSAVGSAAQLCARAHGYLRLLDDREVARDLLLRAEAAAGDAVDRHGRPDCSAYRGIADAWRLAGDIDRARAALRAGLARAATVTGCSSLATAWARHAKSLAPIDEDVRACLLRARSLAASFGDWMDVAAISHRHASDPDGLVDALRKAAAAASTAGDRRCVGRALRDWANRPDEAAAFGPFEFRPDDVAPPGPSPLGWHRDASTLFDWLRAQLDDTALDAIAQSNYGNDRDDHFAALRAIVQTGTVPLPLPWHPLEVARLFHWQSGERVDQRARAFCGAILSFDVLGGHTSVSIEDALAILIESCAILGEDALQRVPGLLCAFLDRADGPEDVERAFAALGLLLCAAQLDPVDARLEGVAERLLVHEAAAEQFGYPHPEHGFVLGATHYDQRTSVWRRLVDEFLAVLPPPRTGSALATVAARLAADPVTRRAP